MQKVYLSATLSGQIGLFTCHMLSWPFKDKKDFMLFQENPVSYCHNLGFEYTGKREGYVPNLCKLWD